MTRPICTVMVGFPGLGKSKYLESAVDGDLGDTVFVYSTDAFIEEAAKHFGTTYDAAFKDNIDSAVKVMDALLDEAIDDELDVYWDQTNLTAAKRAKIIAKMKKAGYDVECICFVPPEAGHFSDLKVWRDRLDSRPGKTIPTGVMTSMMENFVVPTIEEGFSKIEFYNMYGNLVAIDYEYY